jgi:hypothetical protein
LVRCDDALLLIHLFGTGGVVLTHTTQGELLQCLSSAPPSPTSLLVSRECLAVVVYDRRTLVLHTLSGHELTRRVMDTDVLVCRRAHTPRAHMRVQCECMMRDGEYMIVGCRDGRVHVLRVFGLQLLHTYQPCDSAVHSVALTHNHR